MVGKITRQFKADLNGKWDGSTNFGRKVWLEWWRKQTRQWTIKKIDENHYEGKASDVRFAKGFSYRPAFKFEYVLLVPVRKKY